MAKIQLKSDNITPFGGLYPIFKLFSQSGVRAEIDSFLGNRSRDPRAFSYSDIFCSLFSGYLCGGDCVDLDFDHQLTLAEKKDTLHLFPTAGLSGPIAEKRGHN